jgi:glycosyltransferase involved in cell wall biosynthesis
MMRVLIVQYGGDYREAVKRFETGGDETYYAQKHSVDTVAEIGKKVDEIATLCCLTEEYYNEVVENGVRAIGTGFVDRIQKKELLRLVKDYKPTHLILRMSDRDILRWAIESKKKILVTLADSFVSGNLRSQFRNYKLKRLLNHKQVDWVGNHGVTASKSLAKIGVKPDKIIPWDWPHTITPDSFSPKTLSGERDTWKILYVGAVKETKGIGDAIAAVSRLANKGQAIELKVAGQGDLESFKNQARDLQIEERVKFLGLVPNKTIVTLMREADLVLVPSRHEYPEGFPMTIYEALCSRTPIVVSDHPMFCDKLSDRINALIFPAGDREACASCIEQLLSSPPLYQKISLASYETWKSLQIPVEWSDLVNQWLFDSSEKSSWLFQHRLSSGKYGEDRSAIKPKLIDSHWLS